MFSPSIRLRLTLVYAVTLAAILAVSGSLWYTYFSRNMIRSLDLQLLIYGDDIARFHLFSHDQSEIPSDPCEGLEDYIRRSNLGQYVQIYNEEGDYACYSNNLQRFHLPLSAEALAVVRNDSPFIETVEGVGPHPIRLLTLPVKEDEHATHIIQVGQCMQYISETQANLKGYLWIYSPLAFLILTAAGWVIIGQSLSPVSRITRAVRQINANNLDQRLPVSNTGDEIQELAETFNSMLESLEHSFLKTRQFSADASHELRTPLTILRGEAEVALRWAKTPEEFREIMASSMEEIDRMSRIIENLLLLSKSESRELLLDLRSFSLSDLIQELYLQGRSLGEPRSINVTLSLNVSHEVYITGDDLRLRQAFLNLVSNGIKYNKEGGSLDIAMTCEEENVTISFTDTGIGIPEKHLPYIFDRFYRTDEARNRRDGGTGLGLSIVKSIIEAHDGRITVSSTPDGSCFTVTIPQSGPVPSSDSPLACSV